VWGGAAEKVENRLFLQKKPYIFSCNDISVRTRFLEFLPAAFVSGQKIYEVKELAHRSISQARFSR